ncbi:MAG TPA: acyl-CoA dehydrogenase family protein, partial [Acidimicrobiales bacterium]|nr:acyl-CoA dehydrogenase family protein [Acidimicrobiales bacterium]
ARDGGGGIGVFIINCDRPGVRIERLESTDRQEHGRILLSDVEVTPRDLIGGTSHGLIESLNSSALNYLARLYTIGLCALQVGVTKQAVALSAGYVSERTQFGKTLSSFQGVALRAADAYIDSEAIEVTMWQAAWKMAEGLDCDEEISVAKWWASEAGHRVVHAAQHLHGGMGADITYPIHRYFLWGKQIGLEMGSGSSQLVRLGIQLVSP